MSAAGAVCRDCFAETAAIGADPRCPVCLSPRLIIHPERDALTIAHVDCDAFFAAIEKRDDPSLADKPVIVGGGRRGVVMTACYIARIRGVHSAMPMFKALAACPDAVVVRPNLDKYRDAGRAVRTLMQALTPLVEPVSIDEAYLDLGGTGRVHGAGHATTLARFAARVEKEVGISVSVGLSFNKLLAKMASDRNKPRGFSVIGRTDAAAFLDSCAVAILPGLGSRSQSRLAAIDIRTLRQLRAADPRHLAAALGRDADRMLRLARGEDDRRVSPARETKSVSAETTFGADLSSYDDLLPILWELCERVSRRLKAADLASRSVVLKLKDTAFRIRTRTRTGHAPTQLAGRLFEIARPLLREACNGTVFRLIGIGAADLGPALDADRGDLGGAGAVEDGRREAAMDKIRDRFGREAVQKGLAFRFPQRRQPSSGKS